MSRSPNRLVSAIHASGKQMVWVLTGGGIGALANLLAVPGGSRSLLEAFVPYSQQALVDWLGCSPEQFCAARTARAMAMVGFHRAIELGGMVESSVGLACTASLASDRHKKGSHRAHVAAQSVSHTYTWLVELAKGARTRLQEERLVARLVLNAAATAVGLKARLELPLLGEEVQHSAVAAPPEWQQLLLGNLPAVFQGAGPPVSTAILPGSFNPLHVGHCRMLQVGQELLGVPVAVEIAIVNVDKPPLDYHEIHRRLQQFAATQPVWLSRAATFDAKAAIFPGATFLVGADTLLRIADPRYYGGSAEGCQQTIERIAAHGCRFLVFGRDWGQGFVRLADMQLPEVLKSIYQEVPPEMFREDISSTTLRRRGEASEWKIPPNKNPP
jgi:nicotinamide mononucleotide (NMN) deamidase PncC